MPGTNTLGLKEAADKTEEWFTKGNNWRFILMLIAVLFVPVSVYWGSNFVAARQKLAIAEGFSSLKESLAGLWRKENTHSIIPKGVSTSDTLTTVDTLVLPGMSEPPMD